MLVIIPTLITDAMLVSSGVPENDYAVWSGATAYIVGQRCILISTHKIYECLTNNTNASPDLNVNGTTPKWLEISATNRWKSFDNKLGDQTSHSSIIQYEISPGMVTSIALFNLDATTVNITMRYGGSTVVYSQTGVELISTQNIIDGFSYFFNRIIYKTELAFLDLPPFAGTITIDIIKNSGVAKVGEIVVGMTQQLGLTQYSPIISIMDYSRKDVDTFGNYIILQRAYSSRLSCDMWIPSEIVDEIKRILVLYRATPIVWIGAENPDDMTSMYASMMIYGFYKSFNIVISNFNSSACSLEIEGLT